MSDERAKRIEDAARALLEQEGVSAPSKVGEPATGNGRFHWVKPQTDALRAALALEPAPPRATRCACGRPAMADGTHAETDAEECLPPPPAPSELVGHLDNGSEVRTSYGGDSIDPSENDGPIITYDPPAPSEECPAGCSHNGPGCRQPLGPITDADREDFRRMVEENTGRATKGAP